jgi:hypothetical protein
MSTLGAFRAPDDIDAMAAALIARSNAGDVYNSVYTFDEPVRRAPHMLPSDVLFIEVDSDDQAWQGVAPTLSVQTSPGRYHHYFRLDRLVERDEMRRLVKAMVSHGEGDKAAADVSRVLRPPGTWSHKRGASVRVVGGTGEVYSVAEVIGDRDVPAPVQRGRIVADGTDLEAWLVANGVPHEWRPDEQGVKYSVPCPWESEHSTGGDAYVGKFDDGALWFWCPHAHCQDRRWRDFANVFGPPPIGKVIHVAGRRL